MTPPNVFQPGGGDPVLNAISDLRQDIAVMNTKLFGESDGTGKEGRLPLLERSVESHGKRLTVVERVCYGGAGVAGFCYFLLEIYKAAK